MLDDPDINALGAAKWPIAIVMAFFLFGVPVLFVAWMIWQVIS